MSWDKDFFKLTSSQTLKVIDENFKPFVSVPTHMYMVINITPRESCIKSYTFSGQYRGEEYTRLRIDSFSVVPL